MRYALALLALSTAVGGVHASEKALPWQRYARLSSPNTRLEIQGPAGKAVPAGSAQRWLIGHSEMNDCSVADGAGPNVQITCVRRGKYYDTPGKPMKLVFTYTGTFSAPNTLLIVSGTTKGNPLLGQDLVDHFRDEIEE
ncbi:hypothetical protein ACLBXB_04085 [Methylobacterium mesophilicum]